MRLQQKLENLIYSILIDKKKKNFVYLTTAILFFSSIYMLPLELVKAKMLPSKDSDVFSVYVDLPEGASKRATKEVTECIAQNLKPLDEVTAISVFLNEGQPLDFAGMVKMSVLKSNENEAEMMVNIKRAHDRDISSFNLLSKIRPEIQKKCSLYDANIKFIELPAGPPVLASLVAEIYGGANFESQRNFANKIATVLSSHPKLVDVDVLADTPTKEYKLVLDNNKIIQSGISLDQVKKVLYLAFEGMSINAVNEDKSEVQIPLFVRLDDSKTFDDSKIQSIKSKLTSLKLMTNLGMLTPLSEFISIKEVTKDPSLTSKNLNKMINVIAETDLESQIYPLLDCRNSMLEKFDDNYTVEKTNMLNLKFTDKKTGEVFNLVWDGELKVTIDTFIDLGGAFIGALVLIFLLMVVYYQNFALAGGIVLASFLSLFGVIFGHFVMDIITKDTFYLTATSLIGYIGLIGINSRNSLLIIDFAKQLMQDKGFDAPKAVAVATATRAKPILLTVLAIVFASSLLATDAVFGGLGVALIGGTIAAYFVSLFFVPLTIVKPLEKINN